MVRSAARPRVPDDASHRRENHEAIEYAVLIQPIRNTLSGFENLCGVPAETIDGRRLRLVFAPDPAAISDRVEMPEQEGIVDLAGAGLVAAGIVGQLYMGDATKMLLQAARDVALHHLHVVNVVLDKEIVRPDVADELSRLLGAAEEEAGNIDRVDRLDQKPDMLARQRGRGVAQILHQ